MRQKLTPALAVIALTGILIQPVAAAQTGENQTTTPTSENDEEEGGSLVDLSGITEAVNELSDDFEYFTEGWDKTAKEILINVFFAPFKTLAQLLIRFLSMILMHTPDVHPNPAVEEVHNQVLLVTYLLSGLAFTATGILYMTGPLFGVSYSQVRMIIPRILAALIFSTVSLPLLQYAVELSNVLVQAFAPSQLYMQTAQLAGLSTGLLLVYVVEAAVLLVVVVMFIVRNVYIMFGAAISPLLALTWAVPKAKRYADSFIAGWWTALAMAPLDMIVLKFSFAMLAGNGGNIPGSISNWVIGVGSFTLLILVPLQLYGASQAAVGEAYAISSGVKSRAKQAYRYKRGKTAGDQTDFDLSKDEARRLKSYRRKKRQQSDGFRGNWGETDE